MESVTNIGSGEKYVVMIILNVLPNIFNYKEYMHIEIE
jgi:hypothetical protein